MQYHPYSLLLLASAAITLFLAATVWRHRTVPGASVLSLLALAVSWWSFCYTLEISLTSLSQQELWSKFVYISVVIIPPAWLVFTLQYSGWRRWISRLNIALLSVIPAIILALVFTNDQNGLIWTAVWQNSSGLLRVVHGPVFWVQVGFGYACVLAGMLVLAWQIRHTSGLARQQAIMVLVSGVISWSGSIFYITGLNPWPGFDLTPFAFSLSAVVMTFGFLQLRLLDVVPVAHNAVFSSISDGAIVLDESDRIIDLNPAAQVILGENSAALIGQPVAETIPEWRDLLLGINSMKLTQMEISRGTGEARSDYELRISPLVGWRGMRAGRLLMLHDITGRKRREDAEHERRVNAEILRDTAADLTSTLEMEEVLERILINIGRVAPHNGANIMLIGPDGYTFVVRSRGYDSLGVEKIFTGIRMKFSEIENLREMAASRQPSWIPDVRSNPRWVTLMETSWIRSYIGAPILVRGEVVGFLNLDSAIPNFFTAVHAERMKVFAEQVAIAIENARAYDEMRDLAITDEVTGLYNRRKFFELGQAALQRAVTTGQSISVMILDVDHFKSINDTSGHPVGDIALRTIAALCRENLRSEDIIGRYGGDEIVFLLSDCDTATARSIAERLCFAIAETRIPAGDGEIQVTASLGVSTLSGDALTLSALITHADQALLDAKQTGRNRVRIFASA